MRKNITQYIRHNLKSGKAIMVLISVVMLICGPIPMFVEFSNRLERFNDNIGEVRITYARRIEAMLASVFNLSNEYYSILLSIIAAVAGLVLAFALFYYFRKKNSSDFFLSLPITRTEGYIANFVSGVLYYVIPLVAVSLITVIGLNIMGSYKFINIAKLLFGYGENNGLFAMLGNNLVFFLLFFSMGTFSVLLTSNGLNALVVYGTINFYPIAFMGSLLLSAEIFNNDIIDFTERILNGCLNITPILRILFYNEYPPTAQTYIFAAIAFVVFAAISCLLCKIRPAESWSSAIVFKPVRLCLQYIYCYLVAFGGGLLFYAVSDSSIIGFIIGSTIGLVLSFMILNVIFESDIKAIFKKPLRLIWSAVIFVIVFLVIVIDVFGIFRYHEPDVGDVDYVEVSLNHAVTTMNYDWSNKADGKGMSKIENDEEAKAAAIELYTMLHEKIRGYSNTVFIEDTPSAEYNTFNTLLQNYSYGNVRVALNLMKNDNNMRPLRRDFFEHNMQMYDLFKTIYDSDEYVDPMVDTLENMRLVQLQVFTSAIDNGKYDDDYETFNDKTSVAEEFRLALLEDYKNADFDSLQDTTVYNILLYYNLNDDYYVAATEASEPLEYTTVVTEEMVTVDYSYMRTEHTLQIPISSGFTNTLALIEKYCDTQKLNELSNKVYDSIDSIEVNLYSHDGNTLVQSIDVTDRDEITALMNDTMYTANRAMIFPKENVVLKVYYNPELYFDDQAYMDEMRLKYGDDAKKILKDEACKYKFLKHSSALY